MRIDTAFTINKGVKCFKKMHQSTDEKETSMTKKNGSKKRDAKRREQFQKNLSEVFQLASFTDDKVDAEKKDERTELDVTEKKDLDDKNNSTEKNHSQCGATEVEVGKIGQSFNGTKQHDVRFRFELEPSEKLWYEHYLENN